jgi:hypothetical protein
MSTIIPVISRHDGAEPDVVEVDDVAAAALIEFIKYVRVVADPQFAGNRRATTRLRAILGATVAMSESLLPQLEAFVTEVGDRPRPELADLVSRGLNSAVLRIASNRETAS